MADYGYGRIKIGGRIPRKLLPELVELLEEADFDEGNCLAEDGEEGEVVDADALADAIFKQGELWGSDVDASWGGFEELESFLEEHQIPYDRDSGEVGGYGGENVYYRPDWNEGEAKTVPADSDGKDVIAMETIRAILASELSDAAKLTGIRIRVEAPPALPRATLIEGE